MLQEMMNPTKRIKAGYLACSSVNNDNAQELAEIASYKVTAMM